MAKTKVPNYFRKISDIVVPDNMFNAIKTDNPEMDSVLSELGGLIPSQVIMITGNPGSGKTTLSAVIGSRVVKTVPDRPVVFLSYEMSDFQLKLQAQKIPGFSDLLISTHEFHKDAAGLDDLMKALDSINPSMVIVDSLQKMASKMPQGPTRGQIVVVEKFTKWAKKSFTPVLLIGHNDKGGNYAGPSFLKQRWILTLLFGTIKNLTSACSLCQKTVSVETWNHTALELQVMGYTLPANGGKL